MPMRPAVCEAAALRRALEDRLMAAVRRDGGDIQRMRRQAAFDRLLCRLFHESDAPWLLKGGYAMELRIRAARTTRDVDLAIRNLPAKKWDDAAIRSLLESAASVDLEDGFEFTIGAHDGFGCRALRRLKVSG